MSKWTTPPPDSGYTSYVLAAPFLAMDRDRPTRPANLGLVAGSSGSHPAPVAASAHDRGQYGGATVFDGRGQ
jgi:hypothetical protein